MDFFSFFQKYPNVAVACSGGVDSAFLLYIAGQYAQNCRAYFVKTAFQPHWELDDAQSVCNQLGVGLTVLEYPILSNKIVAENPKNRCYHCKNAIFEAIQSTALKDGFATVLDGTNFDDQASDRPGMVALAERQVLSPLRMCGYTKNMIRQGAKDAGLACWNKPAYACLATRVPTGVPITLEILSKINQGENALFALGFTDFRLRLQEKGCKLEIPTAQMELVFAQRETILQTLSPIFPEITLDLKGR